MTPPSPNSISSLSGNASTRLSSGSAAAGTNRLQSRAPVERGPEAVSAAGSASKIPSDSARIHHLYTHPAAAADEALHSLPQNDERRKQRYAEKAREQSASVHDPRPYPLTAGKAGSPYDSPPPRKPKLDIMA